MTEYKNFNKKEYKKKNVEVYYFTYVVNDKKTGEKKSSGGIVKQYTRCPKSDKEGEKLLDLAVENILLNDNLDKKDNIVYINGVFKLT